MEESEVGKETDLAAAGAELLPDGRRGLRLKGWEIESSNRPILTSLAIQEWEEKLGTTHMPEMVFGESCLSLLHVASGVKIQFNTFDALKGWKQESLPPVEVPAAAKWKSRSKPFQQVVLDYDYTFTTPYCGSEAIEPDQQKPASENACSNLLWEDCDDQIDLAVLSSKEPILFYDEVILYEDELADSGVSLLTVKVRVMPSCWFLLLRFWLRVDGALMRLRDTRVYCSFTDDNAKPVILRQICWREATMQSLAAKGLPSDSASYSDPNLISQKLPIITQKTQKLNLSL
uniref:Tip41-like protein n=1 Tax=Hemerocallis fulva TaxID=34190 RepID=A0A7T3P0R2_HEMFU|nr:Tip41-like protein [Hemerocallis fulva]